MSNSFFYNFVKEIDCIYCVLLYGYRCKGVLTANSFV